MQNAECRVQNGGSPSRGCRSAFCIFHSIFTPVRRGVSAVRALVLVAVAGGVILAVASVRMPQRPKDNDRPAVAVIGRPLMAQRDAATEDGAGLAKRPATSRSPSWIDGPSPNMDDADPEAGAAGTNSRGGEMADGYRLVTFEQLADFEYWPTVLKSAENPADDDGRIPEAVAALSGEPVAVTGFMLPLDLPFGGIKRFLLVRNQLMCCFGVPVGMNEWIEVTMKDDRSVKHTPDIPIRVRGVLEVGEQTDDEGWVISIYRMVGDDVKVLGGF